jgi:hypothetical protein
VTDKTWHKWQKTGFLFDSAQSPAQIFQPAGFLARSTRPVVWPDAIFPDPARQYRKICHSVTDNSSPRFYV